MKQRRRLLCVSALLLVAGCDDAEDPRGTIGYVEAEWRHVAAPAAGWITALPVSEGQRIDTGDVLFVLDAEAEQAQRDEATARVRQTTAEAANLASGARAEEILALRARLAEAQARLRRAEADIERVLPLVERGIEPATRGDALRAERDVARASVAAWQREIRVAELAARPDTREAAEAAMAGARAAEAQAAYRLSQRTTRALGPARVEAVILHPGEYATPGAPVVTLLPDDALQVRFFVPQARLTDIALGDAIEVRADGLDNPVTARVSYIATEAEFTPPVIYSRASRDKLVFLIKADLPPGTPLRPGLPVDVRW